MKTIYIAFTEGECGEAQGVFDAEFNLLDFWFCNDATWRNEYFSKFMNKLGIEPIEPPGVNLQRKLEKKLIKAIKEEWGC